MDAYCGWHHKRMEDVTEQEAAECLSYGWCDTCEDCDYLGESNEETPQEVADDGTTA